MLTYKERYGMIIHSKEKNKMRLPLTGYNSIQKDEQSSILESACFSCDKKKKGNILEKAKFSRSDLIECGDDFER